MKIIAFAHPHNGPAYHRVFLPLMTMDGPDVFITNTLKEETFEKGCDLFMYNRVLDDAGMERFNKMREKYGFKVCVDIDDYWHLDPHHILYDEYREEKTPERHIRHIREADVVLTTHVRLAAEIRPFNSNVHVCPNAIPQFGQFDPAIHAANKLQSPYVRIFWQGSSTHEADLDILQRPLGALGPISPKMKMVIAGFHEGSPHWDRMARTYTAGLKHQYLILPGEPATDYYKHYLHADVCLVPLVKSRFNSFKSNLKVLEAANLSLPVIASEVDPYLNMPLLYCKSGSDWVKHITRLVKSSKRRKEAGQELAEYCREHYNFQKINNERRQILEYVATKAGV